jgi:hypothetical protein
VIEKRLKLSYNLNVLGDDTLIFMLDLEWKVINNLN